MKIKRIISNKTIKLKCLIVNLKEHESTHDDSGTWRDCDIEQHVLPNRVVLAVAPSQRNHGDSDGKDLGSFDPFQLEVDGNGAVLSDCDRVCESLDDPDDCRKDYVTLNHRFENGFNTYFN